MYFELICLIYGSTKLNTELNWLWRTKIHTTHIVYQNQCRSRVIFMEDHIPVRRDRCLLLSRQTSKWSLWDVVFHENNYPYLLFGLACKTDHNFIISYEVMIKSVPPLFLNLGTSCSYLLKGEEKECCGKLSRSRKPDILQQR